MSVFKDIGLIKAEEKNIEKIVNFSILKPACTPLKETEHEIDNSMLCSTTQFIRRILQEKY